jgi:hypothetical protein
VRRGHGNEHDRARGGNADPSGDQTCLLIIRARIVGGGTQTTCLTKIDGFPDPGATIRSKGTMAFALADGTIRARVSITQRFARDGAHADQTLRGSIVGGTGIYRQARGTVSGTGTVIDRALNLGARQPSLCTRLALTPWRFQGRFQT